LITITIATIATTMMTSTIVMIIATMATTPIVVIPATITMAVTSIATIAATIAAVSITIIVAAPATTTTVTITATINTIAKAGGLYGSSYLADVWFAPAVCMVRAIWQMSGLGQLSVWCELSARGLV
jgi:hypothetical protein